MYVVDYIYRLDRIKVNVIKHSHAISNTCSMHVKVEMTRGWKQGETR